VDEDVLEHVADGVVVVDAGGIVRRLNPAAERLLGRSSARVAGKPLVELSKDLDSLATRARESNAPAHADGLVLGSTPVDAIAAPLGPRGGAVLTLRDRTVARELEADARHVERVASLATVAAGIAHEVKNPLGGIRGAAQLLSRAASPEQREYLDLIVGEVDRIASLVDRLRDLTAEEETARAAVDVNRLLHELALLQGATGEAQIELDLDPSLPAVFGDADALRRLFLNLLRNALEAPAKTVTIRTRVETGRRFRDRHGKIHALVAVAISDDGPGIPREARERIFQPFFTTKPKGTGLGLPGAQRIAHDHDGTIAVDEAAGGGARFVVTLPASNG
jgi:two-component system nitrogen regulation sensor histidine kinase GlnL